MINVDVNDSTSNRSIIDLFELFFCVGQTQNVKCSCCRETARHWMAVEVWPGAYIVVAHISSRVSRANSLSVQLITSLSTILVRRTRPLTANSHRHARQDTHGTVSSCLVRRCESELSMGPFLWPNPTHYKWKNLDPTRPNPILTVID